MTKPECQVLETTAGAQALDEIESFLEQTWTEYEQVPPAVRLQLGIAAGEIGANIVEHAARGQPVRIRMEVSVLADSVRIVFIDDGVPARVNLDGVSLPDEMAERGRGLALAQAVLDELSYRRTTQNEWTMVSKRFGDTGI